MIIIRWFMKIYQQVLKIYVSTFKIKETILINEAGATKRIASIVKRDQISNILIITDNNLLSLGLLDSMLKQLKDEQITYSVYSDVVPNPTIGNIEEAKRVYQQNNCQAIIAFGGGSVMDCAKLVGVVALTNKPVKRYDMMIPMIPKMTRMYTVPTTAGTGSEVTLSAVITDEQNQKKMPITDVHLAPDYAFLDTDLMIGLPKHITADTGMDALTHAVEPYIGNWKFKVTDDYAVKATALIFENLKNAYNNGKDKNARSQMALGSTYAGYAFRTGGLGYVHGIAHRLSELYHIPHGHANAIVLPHVLRYSFSSIYKKLADLSVKAEIIDNTKSEKEIAMDFIKKIEELKEDLGIPKYCDKIKEEDIKLIAKRAIAEANSTYPVPYLINQRQMKELVTTIMPPETS